MLIEKDPAEKPEETADSAGEGATTADPQAGEEHAASSDSEEGAPETETPEGEAEEGTKEGEREEYEVFFEDEEPQHPAPKDSAAWARLRKSEAEAKRKAAELERKLQSVSQPTGAVDPGEEPTLESAGWDPEKFKAEHREYLKRVAQKEAADAERSKQIQAQQQAARTLVDNYNARRAVLAPRVVGYEDAEKAVIAMLSDERQDVLLKVADDPAKLVYTLGRNMVELEALARETDRDRFVAKLKKLEAKIVEKKRGTPPPPPEESVRGTGVPGPAGSTLERLRAEAAKTGDYSKVNAWKREQARIREKHGRK